MKCKLLLLICISFSVLPMAQTNTRSAQSIKDVMRSQEVAWNNDDWEAFSSHFAEDGTLTNFVGQFWRGRKDILAHFRLLGECCLAPTSLKFEITGTRFLTPTLAIVYVKETLIADRDYDVPFHKYKKGDTDYKLITNVLEKKDKRWQILATQVTLINQMLPPQ